MRRLPRPGWLRVLAVTGLAALALLGGGSKMQYVVFRPYWNAPYGITVREIVPHARRDPSYVDSHNFEIVASGAESAPALPPTPENLDKVFNDFFTTESTENTELEIFNVKGQKIKTFVCHGERSRTITGVHN